MHVKICGITQPQQALAIAQLGVSALGFICVRQSPRYVSACQIAESAAVLNSLPASDQPLRVGVFVNSSLSEIQQVVAQGQLSGVQLHGSESPQFCQQLRVLLPEVKLLKAFRVRDAETLVQTRAYQPIVDALLLDAFHPAAHPGEYGGTGQAIDWRLLRQFRPDCPWYLAGGIKPDNLSQALSQAQPSGIDVSSSVETAPGLKDLAQVKLLLQQVKQVSAQAAQAAVPPALQAGAAES